jgi:hypothetical protein
MGSSDVYPLSALTNDQHMDGTKLLALKEPELTWDRAYFDLGVQMLHRFSLVKLSLDQIEVSMHVMVQTWARGRMDPGARQRQAHAARMVQLESIVSWKKTDNYWARFIAPHVQVCLAHDAEQVIAVRTKTPSTSSSAGTTARSSFWKQWSM